MEIGFSSDVTTSMPMTLLAGIEDSLLFSFEVVSGVGGRSGDNPSLALSLVGLF